MTTFSIRNDADLARAVDLVDALWGAAPGTPAAEALDVMSERIHAYEAQARARVLPPADPRKLIAFKLRELGVSQRELARRLGWGAGRLSEVISGKRALTLNMVRELAPVLGIDPGLLVHDVREESDGGVWVRLPAELVEQAAGVGNGGFSSLQELVEQAVAAVVGSILGLECEGTASLQAVPHPSSSPSRAGVSARSTLVLLPTHPALAA